MPPFVLARSAWNRLSEGLDLETSGAESLRVILQRVGPSLESHFQAITLDSIVDPAPFEVGAPNDEWGVRCIVNKGSYIGYRMANTSTEPPTRFEYPSDFTNGSGHVVDDLEGVVCDGQIEGAITERKSSSVGLEIDTSSVLILRLSEQCQ